MQDCFRAPEDYRRRVSGWECSQKELRGFLRSSRIVPLLTEGGE